MFRNSGPPGSIVKQSPLADSLGCTAPREAQDWEESTVRRGTRSRAGQQDCSNLWLTENFAPGAKLESSLQQPGKSQILSLQLMVVTPALEMGI